MARYFNPLGADFGTHPVINDLVLPASPVTASATTTYQWGPYVRLRRLRSLAVSCITVAAGGGAITATVKRWDSVNSQYITLTAAFDLTALVTKVATTIPLLSTLTSAQVHLNPGDTLAVDIIAAGTVTTQPTSLALTAESLLLR